MCKGGSFLVSRIEQINPRANQWHWLCESLLKIEIHAPFRLRTLLPQVNEAISERGYLHDSPHVTRIHTSPARVLNKESSPTLTQRRDSAESGDERVHRTRQTLRHHRLPALRQRRVR